LRFTEIIDRIEIGICIALYTLMASVNFINVCSRYFLHWSIAFTEELLLICFIWSIMLGIALGYKRYLHLGITFITDMLMGTPKKIAILFSGTLSVVFISLVGYYGVFMVQNQIKRHLMLSALQWPQAIAGIAMPIGALLIVISIIASMWMEIRNIGTKKAIETDMGNTGNVI